MRVNKRLLEAAAFNPTKKSHQMSIWDMCAKISNKSITLPLYQRDLSWTLAKSVALLNYQLLGKAPVSPISFNVILNVKDCVPQVSFIDRELSEIDRGQYSVVDGQQRLTTNFKAYSDHQDFRNIVLDLGKGEFTEIGGMIRNNQIPVGVLLNEKDEVLFDYVKRVKALGSPEIMNALLQVKSKIKNYNYTINSAEDLSEDEQIEWFEVLNNAGSRVSIIQMRFSKLKAHGIDIYTQYTNIFKNKLMEYGCEEFFVPQKTVVSYPIAALNPAYEKITGKSHLNNYAPIPSDTKEDQLCKLKSEELVKCFSLTLDVLDVILDFMDENDLKKPDRIDYINYLIGFAVFNGSDFNEDTKNYLLDWYDNVDFSNKTNSERRLIFKELIECKSMK